MQVTAPPIIMETRGKLFHPNMIQGGFYMKISESAVIQTVPEKKHTCILPAEEVARVKGLGCLWDKRTDDTFNVRVITVNGKLTSDKLAAIAEAAKTFGAA